MNLLNFLTSSSVTPWVILLLLASLTIRILTLVVLIRTLLKSSILNKSQKQSLTSFLQILNSSLEEITPSLLEASRTALSNKGLLSSQKINPAQEQTPEQIPEQTSEQVTALDNFIEFIKAFKEDSNEKH